MYSIWEGAEKVFPLRRIWEGFYWCKRYTPFEKELRSNLHWEESVMVSTDVLYNVILRIARNLLKTSENIKILTCPFYCTNLDWFSWEWCKKKSRKKKFKMANFSKCLFFKMANSQIVFAKILQIDPWVSKIDWCKGHWWSSTYMVVRLSDTRAKTGKKCIFCVFRLFLHLCQTASQPCRLS